MSIINYPNGIDNSLTLPLVVDNVTEVTAETVNRLRQAIIAVEVELGITPKGSSSDVAARLAAVDISIANLNTSVSNVVTEVDNIISGLDGEGIKLGTPSGGFLTPGITTLLTTTPITEAINTFNNIMAYLAPAQPQSVQGLAIDTVTSLAVFSGKIATLTSPPGGGPQYYGPFTAGSLTARITKVQSFTLTTHNTGDATTGFSDADKGIIQVFANDNVSGGHHGILASTFNLGAAFDEAHRSDLAGQGVTYNGGGNASPPLLTVAPTPPATISTQIYTIALFNSFPLWQKGVVRMVNTILKPGYNTFQVVHTVGASVRSSQVFELFFDTAGSTPTFAATPTLTPPVSPTHINNLSGIKFLSANEVLTLGATLNNAFVNTYIQTPLSFQFTVGVPTVSGDLADPSITVPPSLNPAAPNAADQLVVNKLFTITTLNQQTINQIVTVTYTNVYGNTFQAQSAAQNLLINTYNSPASTATADIFVDENRRLVPDINGATLTSAPYPNDYVGLPPTITGQWTSSTALTNGNAQCYNAQLVYPVGNFTSGYSPSQGPSTNYSGFNNSNAHGGQVYYRAMFSSGNPRSTGTLTVNGIVLTDITAFSPHVKVEMKLPGPTGTSWLDFSLPFNNGTFTGAYGQGCRTGNTGGTGILGWSVGGFTTGNSGFMYILRITLFDTARPISSLSESFVQSF